MQPIDASNRQIVENLRVSAQQTAHVASNKKSLMEAAQNPGAWPRAIVVDETVVGFLLLFMPFLAGAIERPQTNANQIVLWRLMIDFRFQNKGFGKQAIELIVDESKRHPEVHEIMSSYIPGPHGPEQFYKSQGFLKTGRLRSGGQEIEIVKPLR